MATTGSWRRQVGRDGGLPLFRAAGIPVLLAPSWWLGSAAIVVLYAPLVGRIAPGAGGLTGVLLAATFAIFLGLSVLAHELGHSLVALRLGLPVRRLRLFLLGGVSEVMRLLGPRVIGQAAFQINFIWITGLANRSGEGRVAALNFADSKDIRAVRCMLKGPGETGVIVVNPDESVRHEYRERHAGHNWTNWRNGLADALEFLLRTGRVSRSDVRGIVVGAGPGSFTGVRVAAATALGLATGLDVPLYAYSSLACLAVETAAQILGIGRTVASAIGPPRKVRAPWTGCQVTPGRAREGATDSATESRPPMARGREPGGTGKGETVG